MNADERIQYLSQETLSHINGGNLAIYGEDNPFFRSIRNAADKVNVKVFDGFQENMPVLMDAKCDKTYMLNEQNDIDHLATEGMSCVAQATLRFLRTYGLIGKHVVIVGRGHAVRGLAEKLVLEDATVTVCHSKTRYLSTIMQSADMLVVAAPIKERFRPRYTSVIVDISGAFAEREESLKEVCEYTKHIGKLTVSVLLERVSNGY